jgi:hypothetical protein
MSRRSAWFVGAVFCLVAFVATAISGTWALAGAAVAIGAMMLVLGLRETR